jgi:hypothetical protein
VECGAEPDAEHGGERGGERDGVRHVREAHCEHGGLCWPLYSYAIGVTTVTGSCGTTVSIRLYFYCRRFGGSVRRHSRAGTILKVIIACAAMPAAAHANDIVGTVENLKGDPIANATVVELSRKDSEARTLADGTFRLSLEAPGPLLIEHPSYGPAFLVTDARQLSVRIVLQPRQSSSWVIPPCRGASARTASPLKTLVLRVSRGLKQRVRKETDFELVTITGGRSYAELHFWKRVVSSGRPSASWFRNIVEITSTRLVDIAGTQGYDVRGTTPDGRLSRWTGSFFSFIEYSAADAAVGRLFDSIIERVCYE